MQRYMFLWKAQKLFVIKMICVEKQNILKWVHFEVTVLGARTTYTNNKEQRQEKHT